eukprot:5659142-Alexandrium_andersonii.AAC.1
MRRARNPTWKRLRPPAYPHGETSPSRAWNRRKSATPSVAALGADGAHRFGASWTTLEVALGP